MSLDTADLILATVAGTGVGFISGLFGVGGGFLLVPTLSLGLNLPVQVIVGSAACQVLGPATASLLARRLQPAHFRLPLCLGGGLLAGIIAGARILEAAQARGTVTINAQHVPAAELLVLGVYLMLLTSIGLFAVWETCVRHGEAPSPLLARLSLPPLGDFPGFSGRSVSIPVLAWFGLAVGFLSGLLGISGGLVLIPGLIYLLGMQTQDTVRAATVIVFMVAMQSTVVHGWHGNIDLALVAALLAGGTAGARVGAQIGTKLASRKLRRYFGGLLLLAAGMVAVRLVILCR